jgi:hypothetical protein
LGLRYPWIDSLCIVQGDVEERDIEASKAPSVYGKQWSRSPLQVRSIADMAAASPTDRPLGRIVVTLVLIQALTASVFSSKISGHGTKSTETIHTDIVNMEKDPPQTRARTLQEWEISTRNIYFTENLVLCIERPAKSLGTV